MKSFKEHLQMEEEVAANSVAGGGVDLSPVVFKKKDKRRKYEIEQMFRRANGARNK